jgi:xanthine dehydrogenase accessory factor
MIEFHEKFVEHLRAGRSVALATIVASHGSTPRKVGTRMLVHPDGRSEFTLGGGPFEAMVIEDAREALRSGKSLFKHYAFRPEGEDATGTLCGGEADVFIEVHRPAERLVIFGGGHVGLALCRLAKELGRRVLVIDERAEYASRERFPAADEIVWAEDGYAHHPVDLAADDSVVIVTHSHRSDEECLQRVLTAPTTPAYVGMIASRRKAEVIREHLVAKGVGSEHLAQVRAPIGLDLGAETPAEIALAILAEILSLRAQGSARPLSRTPGFSTAL